MKKALVLASVASMIEQFNMENIQTLKEAGYSVDVITNFEYGSTMPKSKVAQLRDKLNNQNICTTHVAIPRKIFDIKGIVKSYSDIKKACAENKYKIIHCHSPIGGVVTRLAAAKLRRAGTRVMYTAHGFHFFKGAPLINWLLYFPLEWFCSFFTDVLITINKEDYNFAKKHMHAKKIEYIPGVGVNTEKFKNVVCDKVKKKSELGIDVDDIIVLSVGELNDNKNHETVLKSISYLKKDYNIAYVICGRGDREEHLKDLAAELGVNLKLLGYRDDVDEIYSCCDIYAFPSKREGLSVALMEAMASGLSIVCSNIRGNKDLIKDSQGGYLCEAMDIKDFSDKIEKLILSEKLRNSMGNENIKNIEKFSANSVMSQMRVIYEG